MYKNNGVDLSYFPTASLSLILRFTKCDRASRERLPPCLRVATIRCVPAQLRGRGAAARWMRRQTHAHTRLTPARPAARATRTRTGRLQRIWGRGEGGLCTRRARSALDATFGCVRVQTGSYGMQGMLKDGARHMSGLEEATYKNIEAAKQLSSCVRTSLGPNGMNKMVINHLEKLFITNDSATIVEQLEVQHPAAKLLVMASKMQESPIFSLCFIPALQTPFSHMPHARFSHISGM